MKNEALLWIVLFEGHRARKRCAWHQGHVPWWLNAMSQVDHHRKRCNELYAELQSLKASRTSPRLDQTPEEGSR